MAIDDPIQAANDAIAAEERALSPIGKLAAKATLIAELTGCLPSPAITALRTFLDHGSAERQRYFIEVLKDELRRVRANVERLASESAQHRQFQTEELPGLITDGLGKAEQTRSRSRIIRIAQVLANSLTCPTVPDADEIEELMRIATLLTDQDVLILSEVAFMQGAAVTGDGAQSAFSRRSWAQTRLKERGLGVPEVFSSGAKLESLGLIRETEEFRRASGSPKPWPYALLPRGLAFIQFAHKTAGDGR